MIVPFTPRNTISLSGCPLTLQSLNRLLLILAAEGQVHVEAGEAVGWEMGPVAVTQLLSHLAQRLAEEDKRWLEQAIRRTVTEAVMAAMPVKEGGQGNGQ